MQGNMQLNKEGIQDHLGGPRIIQGPHRAEDDGRVGKSEPWKVTGSWPLSLTLSIEEGAASQQMQAAEQTRKGRELLPSSLQKKKLSLLTSGLWNSETHPKRVTSQTLDIKFMSCEQLTWRPSVMTTVGIKTASQYLQTQHLLSVSLPLQI